MHLISVRCKVCGNYWLEHALAPEHLDIETRRCPRPKYNARGERMTNARCGGKLQIAVKYEMKGTGTWPRVRGLTS